MFSEIRKVKYANKDTTVVVYDNGLESWYGIDSLFDGLSVRNKVVCRVDLCETLSDFFTKETIQNNRNAILYMAEGLCTDPEILSSALQELVKSDTVFETKITNIFYNMGNNESLGKSFLRQLSARFLEADSEYRSFFRGKTEFVICVSDGYLYFAIGDYDYEVELPYDFNVEVLSYARNWKGKIKVTR